MNDQHLVDESQEIQEKRSEKHLLFSLSEESYGISLSVVKEVIALTNITKIPNVPKYFYGLINLRGTIISVIDMRIKLDLKQADYESGKTCIIIVDIDEFTLGFIVDDISSVINLFESQIEKNLQVDASVDKEYICGVAREEDHSLILLLDVGKVLNVEELKMLRKAINTKN